MATDAPARPVHFVGSIPLENAEAVFRAIAGSVGAAAKRWPDGETGVRHYWIRWQKRTFDEHPDFVLKAAQAGATWANDTLERPYYVLRDGAKAGEVTIGSMGYAAAAIESYGAFRRLKAAGTVPGEVRFQVSIPTALALVTGFFELPDRAVVEPVVEAALAREVSAIVEAVPPGELAIQWDVCHEVVGADGGMPLHFDDAVEGSVTRVARHLGFVPQSAEAGIHLCYGDPGHRHIIEPKDLGTCVAYANAIAQRSPRRVDFVHMPVPRGRSDDAYFAPLDRLDLPTTTELYLGLVHFTDGPAGARERMAAAAAHAERFGIATECGFGRRDPATIPALLEIHAAVAGGS